MKISKDNAGILKKLSVSLLAAVFTTLLSLFLVAIIMHTGEIGRELSSPLASICLGIGCFFGGFIYSKISGEKGMLCGLTVSGILFILITLIALLINVNSFGLLTVIHFLVMLLSGAIGGILGVNVNKKIKI